MRAHVSEVSVLQAGADRRLCFFAVFSLALHVLWIGMAFRAIANTNIRFEAEAPRLIGSTFEIELEERGYEERPLVPSLQEAKGSEEPAVAELQPKQVTVAKEETKSASTVNQAQVVEIEPERAVAKRPESPPIQAGAGSEKAQATVAAGSDAPAVGDKGNAAEDQAAVGTYGEEGQLAIRSQLRRSFIKTLPLAAKLDPVWLELDDGELEGAAFELSLGESGQLESVRVVSGTPHPALLSAALKNRAFLVRGRFKIQEKAGARNIVIQLRATVSTRATDQQQLAENKVVALGLRVDPLDKSAEPTGAYFRYDNGRHIEFTIKPNDD